MNVLANTKAQSAVTSGSDAEPRVRILALTQKLMDEWKPKGGHDAVDLQAIADILGMLAKAPDATAFRKRVNQAFGTGARWAAGAVVAYGTIMVIAGIHSELKEALDAAATAVRYGIGSIALVYFVRGTVAWVDERRLMHEPSFASSEKLREKLEDAVRPSVLEKVKADRDIWLELWNARAFWEHGTSTATSDGALAIAPEIVTMVVELPAVRARVRERDEKLRVTLLPMLDHVSTSSRPAGDPAPAASTKEDTERRLATVFMDARL
jgi:hypothetical protein